MASGPEKGGKQPPSPVGLRHTAVLIALNARFGQSPLQQVIPVLWKQHQMIQHIGIHLMPRLQWKGLPLLCLGSRLSGHGIDLPLPCQLQIRCFIAYPMDTGKQRYAVAVRTAEITAVLIRGRVEA